MGLIFLGALTIVAVIVVACCELLMDDSYSAFDP